MLMKPIHTVICLSVIAMIFLSCEKETTGYLTEPVETYYPLEVGKYITYRLDSTVYLPFGTSSVVRSYEVKYHTDALITDNMGRPAFRIIRYIRKTQNDQWVPDATFMSLIDGDKAEFVENNLRYIKLRLPIKNGTTWKGNSYIDTYSINSTVRYLDGWDYVIDSLGAYTRIGIRGFPNTLTVNQRDEILGDPNDPSSYSEINYSVEKYATGVGMIYRKFFHSEYQPGNGGFFADGSYGVEYSIIDNN